jgi:hypothetical protein
MVSHDVAYSGIDRNPERRYLEKLYTWLFCRDSEG